MPTKQILQEEPAEYRCLLRLKLHNNDYEPIAIRGKETIIPRWTEGAITVDRIIREIVDFPDHTNTGLRTGAPWGSTSICAMTITPN
jgi:hypothetical protein